MDRYSCYCRLRHKIDVWLFILRILSGELNKEYLVSHTHTKHTNNKINGKYLIRRENFVLVSCACNSLSENRLFQKAYDTQDSFLSNSYCFQEVSFFFCQYLAQRNHRNQGETVNRH